MGRHTRRVDRVTSPHLPVFYNGAIPIDTSPAYNTERSEADRFRQFTLPDDDDTLWMFQSLLDFTAACPACGIDCLWRATLYQARGDLKRVRYDIPCRVCGPLTKDATNRDLPGNARVRPGHRQPSGSVSRLQDFGSSGLASGVGPAAQRSREPLAAGPQQPTGHTWRE